MSCLKVKNTKEFNNIYKKSKAIHTPYFIIFFQKNRELKFGVVASKKIGNAVYRNRAKRVLRVIFNKYINELKIGNYILVAKKSIFSKTTLDLGQIYKSKINKLFH